MEYDDRDALPERPRVLALAAILNGLTGLALVLAPLIAVPLGAIAVAIGLSEARGDEEVVGYLLASVFGGGLLCIGIFVGFTVLWASWRAWKLSRFWIWVLIA